MAARARAVDDQKNYVALATRYAVDVVSGKIPNCKWVRLAAKRHIDDLKKYGYWTPPPPLDEDESTPAERRAHALANKDRPTGQFYFDPAAAAAICHFGELLPHVKGKWAKGKGKKRLIILQPWQCFILCCLFGWKKTRNDFRRFNEAYLEIPRKNGKSVLAALIGLWMFCMDGEYGAEVYSGATSEKQAWEVFRPAKAMMQHTPELIEEVEAEVWAKSLATANEDRFEPLIGKPGDGSSPHCAIADEFHEHETSDQVDTMQTGMGAREQPIMLMITTAGVNIASPCYDKRTLAQKVLEGTLDNDALFAMIYSIDLPEHEGDKADDWTDPACLAKANPNLDVSVFRDFLEAQQRQATLNPELQNRFKTKHLNVWCAAKNPWMPMVPWTMAGDEGMDLEDFEGEPCRLVLDLASRDDIAALKLLFTRTLTQGSKRIKHHYEFSKYYVPDAALQDSDNSNSGAYRKWHAMGVLTATPGNEIDFAVIKADVLAYKDSFQIIEIVFDPWRATQLAQEMRESGATTVEVRQITANLSPAMKEMLSAVRGGRYHHGNNPVTNWMVSNVVCKPDNKDNIYPVKENPKSKLKIDGAVASIMGMSRAMIDTEGGTINDWLRDPVHSTNAVTVMRKSR